MKTKVSYFRVDMTLRNEKLGYKIRSAQQLRFPYQIVIGGEVSEGTVNVRHYGSSLKATAMTLSAFARTSLTRAVLTNRY